MQRSILLSITAFCLGLTTLSAETFTYRVLPLSLPQTQAEALGSYASQSSAGFKFQSSYIFAGDFFDVFEQSSDTPAPIEYDLRATDAPGSALAAFNQFGAARYALFGPRVYDDGNADLFERTPVQGVIDYVTIPASDGPTASAAEGLLNAQGQSAHAWIGSLFIDGSTKLLFRRDSNKPGPFEFTLIPTSFDATSAATVAALNLAGSQGFNLIRPIGNFGGAAFSFGSDLRFVLQRNRGKVTTSDFTASLLAGGATASSVANTINAQGAAGFRFVTAFQFSDGEFLVFERLSPVATASVRLKKSNFVGTVGKRLKVKLETVDGSRITGTSKLPKGLRFRAASGQIVGKPNKPFRKKITVSVLRDGIFPGAASIKLIAKKPKR